MKIINSGVTYDIYPDDLKSFDQLPAEYYIVRFSMKSGFYLERYYEFRIPDSKIYGIHMEKVKKVMTSFRAFNRNLGVILSGDKGIGKSLFARLLGREAVQNSVPVIIVDRYISGIGSFIDKIDQEVLILFDEFDKTFAQKKDEEDPQAGMLSLFDGVSQGKKLFVVTCNELHGLNSFLVNRPGRFHYHFRFSYPSGADIREYLNDALKDEAKSEIDNVVDFSRRVSLNYDCLRAIAFELNLGLSFSDAIGDLNIINTEDEEYKAIVKFKDGSIYSNKRFRMDIFGDDDKCINIYTRLGKYAGEISFPVEMIKNNSMTGELYVDPDDVSIDYNTYDEDEDEIEKNKLVEKGILSVFIHRVAHKSLHYAV